MSIPTTHDFCPGFVPKEDTFILLHHRQLAMMVVEDKGIFISKEDAVDNPRNVYFSSIKNRFGDEVNTYIRATND